MHDIKDKFDLEDTNSKEKNHYKNKKNSSNDDVELIKQNYKKF